MTRKISLGVLIVSFGMSPQPLIGDAPTEPAARFEARLVAKIDRHEFDGDLIQKIPWDAKLNVVLVLRNPTKKDIKIIIDPDDDFSPKMGLSLELKGPKAVAWSSGRSPQKFGQQSYTLTIPAGKTVEHELSFVWGGKRQWHYIYWHAPGVYTLVARCVGDGKDYEGFVTEPLKLKVTAKKAAK